MEKDKEIDIYEIINALNEYILCEHIFFYQIMIDKQRVKKSILFTYQKL